MENSKQDKRGMRRVRITRNSEISPRVHLISWKRETDFVAGQVIQVALTPDDPPRIYSICSGNREEEITLLFNVKDDGFITPKLAALSPGDQLFVSEPYGSFTGDESPAWWIATGTGIAPFYSMLQSGLGVNKKLIHGARYANQFYFAEEFRTLLGENYVPCCTGETGPGLFPGRVTGYLKSCGELPAGHTWYLCGNVLMVVEARDLLIEKGVPYGNIVAEIYF